MNVLNKIKSKKNQQVQQQTQPIPNKKQNIISSQLPTPIYHSRMPVEEDMQKTKKVDKNPDYIPPVLPTSDFISREESSLHFSQDLNEDFITFIVKKGYIIGKISIFHGFLKGKNQQIAISCRNQTISCPPQSVNKVILRDYLQVGDKEFYFSHKDLIKVVEKQGNIRK